MMHATTRHEINSAHWYCLRSKPKSEHIAAAHVRNLMEEVDVFCPRLRIRRKTSRGPIWFNEALFPGYLFARFNPCTALQAVKSARGVKTIVHFGSIAPTIEDEVIVGLRNEFDPNDMHEVADEVHPGDPITIARGAFKGFGASVLRVLSGANRVQVLLEILGGNTLVEVASNAIVPQKSMIAMTPFVAIRQAA